jgi:putative hemin transport protein
MTTSPLNDALARSAETLRRSHRALPSDKPLRQREAAQALGVSEGELVAAYVGERAVRLQPRFPELFEQIPQLGAVMALTRNEAAVHEKDGVYEQMSHDANAGIALGAAIDLRIFYSRWASGFAVREQGARGELRSLQFYDAQGQAVHKVYLRPHSDHAAYDALVARWADADQTPGLAVTPAPAPTSPQPDSAIDADGLRAAWAAMTDTHQFHGMLRRFGAARTQALRLADPQFVRAVGNDALAQVLELAAREGLSIMVFVGNPGMIQIHTGPVHTVKAMGPWINVLDPGFNLHLRTDLVAQTFVVRKPTADGIVTSLELFDANGDNIAMLFGARKPGQPELAGWRALVAQLADVAQQVPA